MFNLVRVCSLIEELWDDIWGIVWVWGGVIVDGCEFDLMGLLIDVEEVGDDIRVVVCIWDFVIVDDCDIVVLEDWVFGLEIGNGRLYC